MPDWLWILKIDMKNDKRNVVLAGYREAPVRSAANDGGRNVPARLRAAVEAALNVARSPCPIYVPDAKQPPKLAAVNV